MAEVSGLNKRGPRAAASTRPRSGYTASRSEPQTARRPAASAATGAARRETAAARTSAAPGHCLPRLRSSARPRTSRRDLTRTWSTRRRRRTRWRTSPAPATVPPCTRSSRARAGHTPYSSQAASPRCDPCRLHPDWHPSWQGWTAAASSPLPIWVPGVGVTAQASRASSAPGAVPIGGHAE
jgi:hypothetical protein